MNTIDINITRIYHLLRLYRLSRDELLLRISEGLKNPLTDNDIFRAKIKTSHLRKIDKIFNKGLNYYIDPKEPKESKEESIFFRKEKFKTELNWGAKKVVNQFEEEKIIISALSKLSNFKIDRVLPYYSVNDNPKIIAYEIRKVLYPTFNTIQKDFLKTIIAKFADNNILVFEFVETWNKKEKANINGFYLSPNVIVLKRQQKSFRREIFTLIHELGHYLIDEEEIERIEEYNLSDYQLSKVEKWCNDFAYHFLIGEYDDTISKLTNANRQNDYHNELINIISKETHLSKLALYTRMVIINKLSQSNYEHIKIEIHNTFIERQKEEQLKKELDKASGIKTRGSTPKPIKSPLLINTIQAAFFEGVISEAEMCRRLNIKSTQLDRYLQ